MCWSYRNTQTGSPSNTGRYKHTSVTPAQASSLSTVSRTSHSHIQSRLHVPVRDVPLTIKLWLNRCWLTDKVFTTKQNQGQSRIETWNGITSSERNNLPAWLHLVFLFKNKYTKRWKGFLFRASSSSSFDTDMRNDHSWCLSSLFDVGLLNVSISLQNINQSPSAHQYFSWQPVCSFLTFLHKCHLITHFYIIQQQPCCSGSGLELFLSYSQTEIWGLVPSLRRPASPDRWRLLTSVGFFVSFIFIVRVDTVTGEVNALVISCLQVSGSKNLKADVRRRRPDSRVSVQSCMCETCWTKTSQLTGGEASVGADTTAHPQRPRLNRSDHQSVIVYFPVVLVFFSQVLVENVEHTICKFDGISLAADSLSLSPTNQLFVCSNYKLFWVFWGGF